MIPFRYFPSTSVPLSSQSFCCYLSCSHTRTHTLFDTFTSQRLFLLLHLSTFNPLLCMPFSLHLSGSPSLYYLTHSPSPQLSHRPLFCLAVYSIARRDSAFVFHSVPHLTCPAVCPSLHFPFFSPPPSLHLCFSFSLYSLCLSLSRSQSEGLISLHSFSEGHMYFHRGSTIVCLLHLSVKLLNSWRQQVLMEL